MIFLLGTVFLKDLLIRSSVALLEMVYFLCSRILGLSCGMLLMSRWSQDLQTFFGAALTLSKALMLVYFE